LDPQGVAASASAAGFTLNTRSRSRPHPPKLHQINTGFARKPGIAGYPIMP
jgi:hypothetical protein